MRRIITALAAATLTATSFAAYAASPTATTAEAGRMQKTGPAPSDTGRIASADAAKLTITLDDGKSFRLTRSWFDSYKVGDHVKVLYEPRAGETMPAAQTRTASRSDDAAGRQDRLAAEANVHPSGQQAYTAVSIFKAS